MWISNHDTSGLSGQTTQVGHMLDLRERNQSFSALAGYFAFYGAGDNVLTGKGEPERLSGVPVSENFFDVLGVQPHIGRAFSADEGKWGGPKAVMLSHGLWQRRFDLYFPFPLSPETNRWGNTMAMVARLKPGVPVATARAEIALLGGQLTQEFPDRNSFEGFVKPLADQVSGRIRLALWVLAGAVAVVMLIVCANLSNLLLARTASRQKEIAIRSAMGAGRGRLLVQMLTEGIVLSGTGAAVGLALAFGGTRALAQLDAIGLPLLRTVHTDTTALGFTLALAVLTGLVFGLAPAFQSPGAALHDSLKDASRGSTEGRRRSWVRGALVVSEVAFACVLVVGAGLLIRSLVQVLDVDLGFQPARAATIRVDPDSRYSTPEEFNTYFDEVLRLVREAPGVEAASITDALPLGSNRTWGARARGVTYERGRAPSAFVRVVGDGYPAAMGIPLRAGRDISARDTAASDPVIMINETMARAMWPGEDPIGKVILNACSPERRVVGVVSDVRHLALETPDPLPNRARHGRTASGIPRSSSDRVRPACPSWRQTAPPLTRRDCGGTPPRCRLVNEAP